MPGPAVPSGELTQALHKCCVRGAPGPPKNTHLSPSCTSPYRLKTTFSFCCFFRCQLSLEIPGKEEKTLPATNRAQVQDSSPYPARSRGDATAWDIHPYQNKITIPCTSNPHSHTQGGVGRAKPSYLAPLQSCQQNNEQLSQLGWIPG